MLLYVFYTGVVDVVLCFLYWFRLYCSMFSILVSLMLFYVFYTSVVDVVLCFLYWCR